jgi:hypothetical protein
MGREVRRVPKDWQHPKDERGKFIPMHEHFTYNTEEVEEGLRDGWLEGEPPYYGVPVMPQWPDSERTHLMMYECTTEGTPISPAFETPEGLARWLADNNASAFGYSGASYESWLSMCRRGWAPSAIMQDGVMMSGVEGLHVSEGS